MVNFNKACSSFAAAVLEHDTNKIVHIKSKKVGAINRIIQLLIISRRSWNHYRPLQKYLVCLFIALYRKYLGFNLYYLVVFD
jgi:hypothetical protein